MSSPADPTPDQSRPPEYQNEGIRTLLAMFDRGDPAEHLKLGQILQNLQESAFGVFLFVAILPSFIPIPGIGGAVSGPLVILIGAQMLCGLRRPWLPGFIANRGPRRGTMHRFLARIDGALRRLDRLLKPRNPVLLVPLPAHAFSGLLLILVGLMLSLPIPFTNFLFGFQLLLFSLALLERDGVLMAINWIGAIAAVLFFGFSSGQLVQYVGDLLQRWF